MKPPLVVEWAPPAPPVRDESPLERATRVELSTRVARLEMAVKVLTDALNDITLRHCRANQLRGRPLAHSGTIAIASRALAEAQRLKG